MGLADGMAWEKEHGAMTRQQHYEAMAGTSYEPDYAPAEWAAPGAMTAASTTERPLAGRGWIQTYSGLAFDYEASLTEMVAAIRIEDIAHHLSNLCRWAGAVDRFYSVAEHSVLVSRVVPPGYALVGLLHDATEAYCIDVPRPLKDLLPGYREIEDRVWRAVAERFGLPIELPASVKAADNAVLTAEAAALLGPKPRPWKLVVEPAPVTVACYGPREAKLIFLDRFYQLTGGR